MLTLIPYFGWLYNHLSGQSYISNNFGTLKLQNSKIQNTLWIHKSGCPIQQQLKLFFVLSTMQSMLKMSYCNPKYAIWRMINKFGTCVDSSCVSLHSSLVILVCVSALFEPLWGLKIKIERERSVWRLTVNQVREKIRIDISEYF